MYSNSTTSRVLAAVLAAVLAVTNRPVQGSNSHVHRHHEGRTRTALDADHQTLSDGFWAIKGSGPRRAAGTAAIPPAPRPIVYGAWRPGSLNQKGQFLPDHGSRSSGQPQRRPIPGQFCRCRPRRRRLIVHGFPIVGGRFGPLPCPGPATGLPPPRLGHRIKRSFTGDFYVCTTALKPAGCTRPMPPKAQKAAV